MKIEPCLHPVLSTKVCPQPAGLPTHPALTANSLLGQTHNQRQREGKMELEDGMEMDPGCGD